MFKQSSVEKSYENHYKKFSENSARKSFEDFSSIFSLRFYPNSFSFKNSCKDCHRKFLGDFSRTFRRFAAPRIPPEKSPKYLQEFLWGYAELPHGTAPGFYHSRNCTGFSPGIRPKHPSGVPLRISTTIATNIKTPRKLSPERPPGCFPNISPKEFFETSTKNRSGISPHAWESPQFR